MDIKSNTVFTDDAMDGDTAKAAAKAEAEAKLEPDENSYTHIFKHPFTYQGVTVDRLVFNWGALTGADHLAIEDELLRHGKTLVAPEFTGDFLCAMAARACANKTEGGFRLLSQDMLKAMPMRDFQTICKRARSFLLRAEL